MGFWKKLFGKRKKDEEEYTAEWDRVQSEKNSLNMKDSSVRQRYVVNCLEQMREASSELDRINAEYALVTSYLTDMEDIEALEGDAKAQIESIARHIHDLRRTHDDYVLKPSLMTDEEYSAMELMESEAEEGIGKLTKEEDYREKVKSDLNRIDKERSAYEYRRREIRSSIENSKGVATIAMTAAVVLIIILLAIQTFLKYDVAIGYYITIIILAITVTVIYVRYTDRISEKKRVDNTINELILLENKVKIRYVNNRNLLEYLYTKYGVSGAAELKDLWERYKKEKEERRNFERNEAVYEDELSRLIRLLRKLDISYPDVWMHQTDALYDSREMVEIRHKLIGRRQKLRKRLEYNEQIAREASDEIKGIIRDYPEYADSVMRLVEQYEK
ncbi:MAG: hypothetical protein K5796_11205 [Lachnospiraceae bacterium]|nr:hypothetical protein [Lachnospiraceae bacterium]